MSFLKLCFQRKSLQISEYFSSLFCCCYVFIHVGVMVSWLMCGVRGCLVECSLPRCVVELRSLGLAAGTTSLLSHLIGTVSLFLVSAFWFLSVR